MTAVDTKILKNNFGPFPAKVAVQCCETVQKIIKLFPADILDNEKDATLLKAKRYGCKMKINIADDKESENFDDSDSEYETDKGDHFATQFKEQLNLDQAKRMQIVPSGRGKTEAKPQIESESTWLLDQCQVYFPHHDSPETMATALYDVLISNKNDAEIQNELFELVGFDAIDLIGQLLKKRKDLVSLQNTDGALKFKSSQRKPLIASQVTIQVKLKDKKSVNRTN